LFEVFGDVTYIERIMTSQSIASSKLSAIESALEAAITRQDTIVGEHRAAIDRSMQNPTNPRLLQAVAQGLLRSGGHLADMDSEMLNVLATKSVSAVLPTLAETGRDTVTYLGGLQKRIEHATAELKVVLGEIQALRGAVEAGGRRWGQGAVH
jgi:hypothetical protein